MPAPNSPAPIAPAAKKIAASAKLLCFDEFQVTQIADAMILARLFEALFERGVTVVATSNRHPDALYKNGINRALFLPFIETLKANCDVFELETSRDYRLERLSEAPVWNTPLGPAADKAMDVTWTRLTLGAHAQSCALRIKGRTLDVPREAAQRPNARCAARGCRCGAVQFRGFMRPPAKTKLVASAAAEPDALYPSVDGSFVFQRTASRLLEMRSLDYMAMERESVDTG